MSEQSHGNHPYHLVEPSKWPIVGASGAFLTMFSLVLFLHPDTLGAGLEPFFETIGLWVIAPGVVVVMMTGGVQPSAL